MNPIVLAVVGVALLVSAGARKRGWPVPLVLVIAGLVVGAIPGVPNVELDPDVVLFVVLPPLLYSAALDSSYLALRRNIRPIGLLAVGLPLATAAGVGLLAYWLVPQLTLAGALVLGAIVAPPDAVSATAIGRQLGLPRRLMTLLGGESLLNDATALTAYKVSLAATVGTGATFLSGTRTFAIAAVGGVVIGLIAGVVVSFARSRIHDSTIESAFGMILPFAVYLLAEEVHASGVIAVVVAGLYLGQRSTQAGYATRLQDAAVWRAVELILESFVFILIGLQLPAVVEGIKSSESGRLAIAAVSLLAAMIVIRVVWIYIFTYAPRGLSLRIREQEEAPSARAVFIVAWAGMRGVVSLAAAFAIPLTAAGDEPFAGRAEIIFLTFTLVVATLLLHGLTLPPLIRALGVTSDDARRDALAQAAAQDKATRAAAERLNEILKAAEDGAEIGPERLRAAETLHGWNTRRRNAAWEKLGRGVNETGESPAAAFRALRLEMLAVERAVFIAERDAGRIDDEVLRTAMHGLDLEEATLNR